MPPSILSARHVLAYAPKVLRMLDLTGSALKQMSLNNDISASNDYEPSMRVSKFVHDFTDLDGILYISRQMNTGAAAALFERSALHASTGSVPLVDHPDYKRLLDLFQVEILPSTAF